MPSFFSNLDLTSGFCFFQFYYLFMTNVHIHDPLPSEVLWNDAISLGQLEAGVIWLTHPANGPTDTLGFKLAVEPACGLVSLGHVHWDGRMVFGADDAFAGRTFPRHSMTRSTNLLASVCMLKACLLLPPRAQKVASVLNWDFAKI